VANLLEQQQVEADRLLCAAIIAEHSKSFALASRLLPTRIRDQTRAIYAWCRRADDTIDDGPSGSAAASLERLFRELEQVYSGDVSADPVLRSFARVVEACSIPKLYPTELLRGMEMDVRGTQYRTQSEQLHYCYRAAGTVGLMMCHVMGLKRGHAVQSAAHLGIGMQLTNICRDVQEDWQRGRMYLSDEVLELSKVDVRRLDIGSPLPRELSAGLASAVRSTLDSAERYYRSADDGAMYLSAPCALAVRGARHIYSRIGHEIARADYDVFAPRAHTSGFTKLRMLGRAALEVARTPRVRGEESSLPLLEFKSVGLL
jgi:phytoene synthase